MKNRRFWVIVLVFTISVPGFMVFSYWHLGVFSSVEMALAEEKSLMMLVKPTRGDASKAAAAASELNRLFHSMGKRCTPVLVYFDDPQKTIKANLRAAGGCIAQEKFFIVDPAAEWQTITLRKHLVLTTYAQTAVALRKVWRKLYGLRTQYDWQLPLVQVVQADGTNEFRIAIMEPQGSP
ncbi:MAG: hypothetical protein N2Z22_11875 [Turneriella sp.]|nr:hypothetical protein [Turneriella sp.]